MTNIFCELLSIKEPQTTLQNKETTVQSYRKMSIQNTKKSLGTKLVLLTVRERWEWTILVVWMAHLLCSYFVTKLRKENYGAHTLTAETPPSPNTSQYAFRWTILSNTGRTYFMDDPQQDDFLIFKQNCIYFVLYMFYFAWNLTFSGLEFSRRS